MWDPSKNKGMKIYFIRHGKTMGNIEKRYIGITDEPLCQEGIIEIKRKCYPMADVIISSPMLRCIETSQLIYPGKEPIIYEDLREMDFGVLEGKNYKELQDHDFYRRWVKSGGNLPIPRGEGKEGFCRRCSRGFELAIKNCSENKTLAFVVHGGTIMAILDKYALPHKEYYEWQVGNGECIILELENGQLILHSTCP